MLFTLGVSPAFGRFYLAYVAYCVGFGEIYYSHLRGRSDQCEGEIIITKIIFFIDKTSFNQVEDHVLFRMDLLLPATG